MEADYRDRVLAHTRGELLVRCKQLAVARDGLEIFQRKLDVLMKELLETLLEIDDLRRELAPASEQAGARLAFALALDGEAAVRSAGLVGGRELGFTLRMDKVMGAPAPRLLTPPLVRSPRDRGYSVCGVSARIIEASEGFERMLELLIRSAAVEARFSRLGAEAAATRRRRNALDHITIPRLESEAKEIERALDERAREDLFRLKLGKRRLEERREVAGGGPTE